MLAPSRSQRRWETTSVGFDDFLSTLPSLPYSTGIRVPPLVGPTYRILACALDLTAGDRLVGFRQYWSIAHYESAAGGLPPVYPEIRPVVTPGWRFVDIDPPVWTVTLEPLRSFPRQAGPFDQDTFIQRDTQGPALVYETAAFPPLPPLPGYLGLSAYTPPPIRGRTIGLYRDIRFPQQQNEFFALDVPIETPMRVRLYVDIQQTNPAARDAPDFADSLTASKLFFTCGFSPEEQFLQLFPDAIVHAAGASVIYDRT